MSPHELVRKYLGIPYVHMGRTMEGLDCWGLIILVYRDLGFELFDLDNYEFKWSHMGKNYFAEKVHEAWERVTRPFMYDGVLLQNEDHVCNHAGVYVGEGYFLHCCKKGVCKNKLTEPYWKKRFYGYFTLKARNVH